MKNDYDEPVAWRDHVEQRLHTWRQRFVNRSGDQLALDDFMDKQTIDDLIDYVCDEYIEPRPAVPQQAEPVWVRPDQMQKARQAPFLCRVSPTKDALDLAPLYLHPPSAEVQRLRDALTAVCAVADDREEGNYDTVPIHFIRSIARDAMKGGK